MDLTVKQFGERFREEIISNCSIFALRAKGIRRINRNRPLSTLLRSVLQIHLLLVAQRRIRRSACRMLYANHIIYDWVPLN